MALDFAALMLTGVQAAQGVGATASVTITRPAPAPNPLTGVASGSAITQTIDAVPAGARTLTRGADAWARASVKLFAASAGMTFAPKVGDTAQFAGSTLRVTVADEFAPAGVVVGYFLGCG